MEGSSSRNVASTCQRLLAVPRLPFQLSQSRLWWRACLESGQRVAVASFSGAVTSNRFRNLMECAWQTVKMRS